MHLSIRLLLFCLLSLSFLKVFSQVPPDTNEVPFDTLIYLGEELLPAEGQDSAKLNAKALKRARKDSIRLVTFANHDPNKAYKRSAALPGWGQYYNKSYWKIPLIYGGFAGLGYTIGWNHSQYKSWKTEYSCRLDTNCTDNYPEASDTQLKEQRDFYRRNRDLSIIITFGWYAINIIDAYIDAHLKTFDVSDDLSMSIKPRLLEPLKVGTTPAVGLGIKLQLKPNEDRNHRLR